MLDGLYLTQGRIGFLSDFLKFIFIFDIVLILCPFSEMDRKGAYAKACILGNVEALPELRILCKTGGIFLFAR